jgi:hypothetical protein|nr:hypothetical protein [uncultured Dubosiella sp.]
MPIGFFISLAIFARNRFGPTPIEHESPISFNTPCWIWTAMSSGRGYFLICSVTSRKHSSIDKGSSLSEYRRR